MRVSSTTSAREGTVFWVARPDPPAVTPRARHKADAHKPSIQAWFEGFLLKVAS